MLGAARAMRGVGSSESRRWPMALVLIIGLRAGHGHWLHLEAWSRWHCSRATKVSCSSLGHEIITIIARLGGRERAKVPKP